MIWIEQNLGIVFSVLIGIASFLILLYVHIKDSETSKRLDKFEISIDNLHDEVYKLQKMIKKIQGEQEEKHLRLSIKWRLKPKI
ncbi:hypothetical protein BBW65_00025 [Helicobacter enhydrae]|uniref:Periplasmic protein n=1 Tax=Helicobacter enhydrae TaxID=222136 RepID=A0A1B1U3I6_9HELI|nr:hypothetical protein [Helicobacter enhydrae]ANV97310.1 hypothetical protein BBW65_00025 [Helicobacter enhydrae]